MSISEDRKVHCADGSVLAGDVIVCTGTATEPRIPDVLQGDAERLVHSAHLTQDRLAAAQGQRLNT